MKTSDASETPLILPVCAIFRRFLKKQGLKFTVERAMILDAVLAKRGVFEAEELLNEMRTDGQRVSKATIYRTLKHLVDARIVNEVLLDSRQAHYELAFGREPSGHLVCVETNRVIEFPIRQLKEQVEQICREHGFLKLNYRFVIYGSSPEAQRAEQADEAESDEL